MASSFFPEKSSGSPALNSVGLDIGATYAVVLSGFVSFLFTFTGDFYIRIQDRFQGQFWKGGNGDGQGF